MEAETSGSRSVNGQSNGERSEGSGGGTGRKSGPVGMRVALLALFVLLVGLVAVPTLRRSDDGSDLVPLGLSPGSKNAGTERAAMDMAYWANYKYVLKGDLPDLGSEAPVYKLVAPPLDAAAASSLAKALGVNGSPTSENGGFTVADDGMVVSVWPSPAGWYVSMWRDSGDNSSSGVDGGSSSGSSGSGSVTVEPSPGEEPPSVEPPVSQCEKVQNEDGEWEEVCWSSLDETVVEPDRPTSDEPTPDAPPPDDTGTTDTILTDPIPTEPVDDVVIDPWQPDPPKDLPSEQEAERIARDLLDGAGMLGGEWDITVEDSGMIGVAYAESCDSDGTCTSTEGSEESVVYSRMVVFTRLLDGRRVEGLGWSVEIGDEGAVQSLWGQHANVEPVADYPLRPIQDAYDSMVAGEDTLWGYGGTPAMMEGGAADLDVAVLGTAAGMSSRTDSGDSTGGSAGMSEPVDVIAIPPADPCGDNSELCSEPGSSDPGVIDCKVQPDGSELCEMPEPGVPGDPNDTGIATCKVQPDGSEICEAPVPGVPVPPDTAVSNCEVQTDGTEICETRPDVPGGSDSGGSGCKVQPDGSEICEAPVPGVPGCVTQPDGSEICEVPDPDVPGCVTQPDGSEICEVPDPTVIAPEPPPEPEEIVITVKGAELGLMIIGGIDQSGAEVAYVAASYRFLGTFEDGSDWSTDIVALDPEWITGPTADDTTTTAPDSDTTSTPKPTVDPTDTTVPPETTAPTETSIPSDTVVPPETTVPTDTTIEPSDTTVPDTVVPPEPPQ